MDFGTSPTDILNCNASFSSQQSQIAQCLERLESPAGSVSSEVSAPCSQNGTIQVSAIPTWLSNGMLGTSTSDTQSTGALPPVSELRPGIRARGGLQLWTLSAQMAYSQSVPDSAHASALAEKHDLEGYSNPNAAYIDTGSKTQSVGQHSQHHSYQTAAAFSYCDIQRPDLSHAESLASLESAVEQMPQTDPVLDADSIESAYQQCLCIPLLNIPNAGVSVEQQPSLNGVANDSLFCASKSVHSIPSSLQVQTAPEQKQSSNPSDVASILSPGDSRMSVQSTVPIQSPVPVLQKTLGTEKAVSLSGDLPSITSKPLSTAATVASNISQPVTAQVQISERQKQDTTKTCVSKKVQPEQPVAKPSKKAFSAASLVEEVICYRCKVCKFLHESRAELLKHAESHHRGSAACCVQRRSSFQQGPQPAANRAEKRFLCGKCRRGFFTLDECCRHLSQAHQAKSKKIRLEWIYTNQPDRMRASTPADEVADLHPLQADTPAQQPLTLPRCGAPAAAPARPKQQPKCTTPKRKEPGDNVVCASQAACRQKVGQEQGSFICERKGCNVRFREVENLEYHVKCHRADTPDFACPECSVVCLRWRTMTGHLWRHHLCDMELHQCDQCDFRTYSLSKLENLHKRIHGEERPFLCDVCGKGFKTGKQLRNHKAIHRQAASGQRSATTVGQGGNGSSSGSLPSETCCECGRCFRGRRLLQYHRDSVHRKLRPFLCSYCGHRASSQSSLKMHLRQHTGEKPFACNLCEYRTGDHNSLRRHKMRHSGTKPYKCPHCPYACIQSSTFKSHLHRKHPGQSDSLLFACPLCSFRTVREDNYKAHLFDHSTSEAHSSHSGPPMQASAGASLTLGDIVGFAQQSAS